jgi:hypothetical protein
MSRFLRANMATSRYCSLTKMCALRIACNNAAPQTKVDSRWELGQEDENHAEDPGSDGGRADVSSVSHDNPDKVNIADHNVSVQRPLHLKVHGGTKHQVVSKLCCLM